MGLLRRKLQIFILVVVSVLAMLTVFCDQYFFNVEHAPVRLIMIEKTSIPQFTVTISSIPLALAALYKYGERSFAIVPANSQTMRLAFKDAEFIVVGAHGSGG